MVKKTAQQEPEAEPELKIPLSEAQKLIGDRVAEGTRLLDISSWTGPILKQSRNDYYSWDEYNCTLLSKIFSSPKISKEYAGFGFGSSGRTTFEQEVKEFQNDVKDKIRRLESIYGRLPLYAGKNLSAELAKGSSSPNSMQSQSPKTNNVFIVHGTDDGAKQTVARFIGLLRLNPIILHEKANEGKTLIEKFEAHSEVSFAVVLLTPDDVGYQKSSPLDAKPRARQNVILELGYFLGKLGRPRVCALYSPDVELPSDFQGVAFVPFNGEGWKLQLAREMKIAGLSVDLNDVTLM